MKSEVLTDSIPTKKWVEVPCALTDSQRELYIDILEKNHAKLNGAIKNGAWTTYPPFPFQLFYYFYLCIQFSLVNVGLSNVYFIAFLLFHWER
jgi:hypothetical protein